VNAPRIYVVDDSPDVGEMLEVFLSRAGYLTRVFSEPLKALDALQAADPKPELLVTDFRMPGLNGLELIQRCKAIHPALKVISASAYLPEDVLASYPFKPDRILPKPYSSAALIETVRSLLSR
jgi:CheY-like chemotaxis protein